MSYAAFVICRCYQDGKTSPAPYSEFVKFDEDGLYLELPEPEDDSEAEWDVYYEKNHAFDNWKSNACEHEDMELASESIANSMGMSGFKQFLYENGGEQTFKVLLEQLPRANGGAMTAANAAIVLQELAYLKAMKLSIDKVVLRDKVTKQVIMIGDYEDDIPFAYFDKNKIALLNKDGFYILEREMEGDKEQHIILFHAREFYTLFIKENEVTYGKRVDKATLAMNFTLQLVEHKHPAHSTDFEVVKETYDDGVAYWSSVIESLELLCKAAVTTQNPVHWC